MKLHVSEYRHTTPGTVQRNPAQPSRSQTGFRLCLVHRGFHIASATKAEVDAEDDLDRLKRDIPQGHMEVVVLGDTPIYVDEDAGGHIILEVD